MIGGSGLLALGLITRPTKDFDLLAVGDIGAMRPADPLPPGLQSARDRVAADFGLPTDWLNGGPTSLLDFGLPNGFDERLEWRRYGAALRVAFASRLDQVHSKLYAAVDSGGPGKHEADLRRLQPTSEELLAAARWTRTHDPSDGYRDMLVAALEYFGVSGADLDA